MNETLSDPIDPAEAVALLADLVEVLLPGDGSWPSGSTVGVQAPLVLRLIEQRGRGAVADLMAALTAAGGPLDRHDEAGRIAIVVRFEAVEPDLFGWIRDAAYVAYYENPFVAEVINGLGFVYELRPHVKGYPVQRFDLARDTPRHGRGHYLRTDEVRRLDISALDLPSERTQAWGLKR